MLRKLQYDFTMCPHTHTHTHPRTLDIDECRMNPCSHDCWNTIGSFYCTCPVDSRIMEDMVTCDGNAMTTPIVPLWV